MFAGYTCSSIWGKCNHSLLAAIFLPCYCVWGIVLKMENDIEDLCTLLDKEKLRNDRVFCVKVNCEICSLTKLDRNVEMVTEIMETLNLTSNFINVLELDVPFTLIDLEKGSASYRKVKQVFSINLRHRTKSVGNIQMILNPYLAAQYMLRNLQKKELFGSCRDIFLYHVTHSSSLELICKNNFDWRYLKKHLFGQGISFARYASYACNYPKEKEDPRAMIMSKVSFVKLCEGDENMVVPKPKSDTSAKGNGDVWVKYDDAEYYPLYIIYYRVH